MVDVECRLFVVPGEQPTEGVERKGVFGVETRAFPRLAQRLLPLEVAREGVGPHGVAETLFWREFDEARGVFEGELAVSLQVGQPVQRAEVVGGGFDGSPSARIGLLRLVICEVSVGEETVHSR